MELIIHDIARKMPEEITKTVLECGLSIEELAPKVLDILKTYSIQIIEELIHQTDEMIFHDKNERRKEGWVLERQSDSRSIMSQLGAIRYERRYYRNRKTGAYAYLVDPLLGVDPYMRVDTGLSKQLVRESRQVSYSIAAENSCNGMVSKQTVMNKIRTATPIIEVPMEKSEVPELHIDADEDHVAMQDKSYKSRAIVPIVSVYEGIEENGNRKSCKNIFHMSCFKKDADTLWDETLHRIEQRYDLRNTRIYLHGDGASWIAKGLEWLPKSSFVLDMYHKNKYIRQMISDCEEKSQAQLRNDINQALYDMDEEYFDNIVRLLIEKSPKSEKRIAEAAGYLRNHMPGIAIRTTDPSACNGGATEPHVSHVLSSRLSSRPKGWSEKTLKFFTPILANGPDVNIKPGRSIPVQALTYHSNSKTSEKLLKQRDAISFQTALPVMEMGKRTELYKAIHGLSHITRC